jgi:hypothetical protein
MTRCPGRQGNRNVSTHGRGGARTVGQFVGVPGRGTLTIEPWAQGPVTGTCAVSADEGGLAIAEGDCQPVGARRTFDMAKRKVMLPQP